MPRPTARGAGVILAALTFLLAGCAFPQDSPARQAASSVLIVADTEAQLGYQRVEVLTAAAPPVAQAPDGPLPQAADATPAMPAPAAVAPAGHAWIEETMAKYGVYPAAGTKFVIGPMPSGCEGADGCTQYAYYPDTGVEFDHIITIRPGQLTEYLLFHEIAHTRGIHNECGADNFARSVLGPVPGHYC